MPQPLSSFGTLRCTFYENDIEKHPHLAVEIVRILTAWAHLETKMGAIFSQLLGGENENGVAIYNVVSNMGAHTVDQVFGAVERVALASAEREVCFALRLITRGVRDLRNPIAHGFWGLSPDIPDALLLRSPRESLTASTGLIRRFTKLFKDSKGRLIPGEELVKVAELKKEDIGEVFVYRKKDFEFISKRIQTVSDYWSEFDYLAFSSEAHIVEQARRRLLGRGEVLDRVNKARADKKESLLPPAI